MVDVTRATLPFLSCMVVALVLVTYVPALTVVPPAKPRGNTGQLIEMVQFKRRTLGAPEQVTAPDGKVLKLIDCAEIKGAVDRGKCEQLFIAVGDCRKNETGDAAKQCETDAIKAYIESTSSVDDLSTDDLLKPTGDDDDDIPDTLDGLDGDDDDDAPDTLDGLDDALDDEPADTLDELEKELDDEPEEPADPDDDEAADSLDELDKMLENE
jgi:hypothetical protein